MQRWKLDNNMLKNKAGLWKSDDDWNFIPQNDGLICIENTSKQKMVWTLGALNKVTLETFVEAKVQQLWKKGEPDAEGFITLEKSEGQKVITAISESGLEIKGNITLRWITS